MESIDKINIILAQKGMSGADLERKIGVSNSVYSQWNTKTTKPSNKSLLKVAKALEVDVSEITSDKAKKEKPASLNENGQTDSNIQKLLDSVSDFSESEMAILFEQIKKIKNIRI